MKNKYIFLITILILYTIGNKLTAIDKDLQKSFDDIYNYQLVKCTTGNFTGSKKTEYLCHYRNMTTVRLNPNSDVGNSKFCIYIVENNKILNKFNVDTPYGSYDKKYEYKIVHNKKIKFGKWDGYCYIGDFNSNGIEEILIFVLSGMSFEVEIYEFNGKDFEEKLKPPTFSLGNVVTRVETGTKSGNKYLEVWGETITEKDNTVDFFMYSWNPKTGYYEIIEKGFKKMKVKCIHSTDCIKKNDY